MTSFKTTVSALTLTLLAAGGAFADINTAATVDAEVQVNTDPEMASDALEGTRNTLNQVGALGRSAAQATGNAIGNVVDATGNVATAVVDTAGEVGADAIFNIETALEAGTSTITSADGVEVGQVTGVTMTEESGQLVTVDLNDALGFKTDRVSISSNFFVKGDGNIGLRMTEAELQSQVAVAAEIASQG